MSTAAKFTFDTEFLGRTDKPSADARARQRKTLTVQEIDDLCAAARHEGEASTTTRAAEALERAVAALTITLRAALDQSHAEIETVREETALLALSIAAKLAPAAVAALPAADVETALRQMLHQAIGEPRVMLSAAPAIVEAIEPRIKDIAHEEGYEGRVVLHADPALPGGDCRIEWRGGGSERSGAHIEQAIEALVAHLFSPSEPPKG
jgi:flagellar assembly protein FliH